MSMGSRIRFPLLIVTAFWAYVTVSDILYADSLRAGLSALNVSDFFAPWTARLLQHLFLYPGLLACVWAALRIGWRPILPRLPLQLLLAVSFSTLAYPAMALALVLAGGATPGIPVHEALVPQLSIFIHMQVHIWIATCTSFLLTYAFALALVGGFDLYRQLRDSQIRSAALERALSAAHLAALRMQLSPHSLFNLLHTIRGQIDWDPAAARTMIVQLGDLLRRLLNAGEREYSRLADEVQFARLYLELQQRRFADRLTVELPEPAKLPAVWVPSLILQPLIENAVVHGLAGHQNPVRVRLEASVAGGELTLRVINTMAAQGSEREGGIGLKNVRERLAIQFGDRAGFSAGASYDHSWLAEIRMPLLTDVLDDQPATTGAVGPAVSSEPV
jgi:two-component system, LytTR family, sensor kinase